MEYSRGSLTSLIYLNRPLQRHIGIYILVSFENTIELRKGTHVATWKTNCKWVLQNKFCLVINQDILLLATVIFLLNLNRNRNLNFFFLFLFDYTISEPNLQIKKHQKSPITYYNISIADSSACSRGGDQSRVGKTFMATKPRWEFCPKFLSN